MSLEDRERIEYAMRCPKCTADAMRLVGVAYENEDRDLCTFECRRCHYTEAKSVILPRPTQSN